MFTLDYITLNAFYKENSEFFTSARLQKIQQPTRREFILTIRGLKQTKKLYINIDPQIYHLCFIKDETFEKRGISIPQKPPMFCMLLRKYLEGARISRVNLPEYERIFEIYFESYNELNEKITLCLAIELMGKYSNVILYNTSSNIILGCAHNVGSEKSRERELAGTLPYVYPAKQTKSDLLKYFGKLNYDELNEYFLGISQSYQELFRDNLSSLDEIKTYLSQENIEFTPAIDENNGKKFCVYSELLEQPRRVETVNEMIDEYFSSWQENILIRAFKLKLKNIVSPKLKRIKNSVLKIEQQLNKKTSATKFKKYADLIMSNLYNQKDYVKSVVLTDWESGKELKIPLDENLSLRENAQNYYRKFSNSKNDREKLEELISENRVLIEYFDQLLYTIDCANSIPELREIMQECEDNDLTHSKKVREKQKDSEVEQVVVNGFTVLVGKNNKQNDKIITKLSSPEDIWFHVQNSTGSHVLLKTNNKVPDEGTIFECCKLAKRYSSSRNSGKAGVIYTKRKYLRKPPKSNLGYVTYKNEVEIIVD